MPQEFYLIFIAVLLLVLLGLSWIPALGGKRAFLAFLCRAGWCLPFFLAFFPRSVQQELPRTLSSEAIHVLVDDSQSMRQAGLGASPYQKAVSAIEGLRRECTRLACNLKTVLLSDLDPLTASGYTPLSQVLPAWLGHTQEAPWILFSDGGDFQPKEPWPAALQNAAVRQSGIRGLIYSFAEDTKDNVNIAQLNLPPFAFTGQALSADLSISRSAPFDRPQSVQVQAYLQSTEGSGRQILAAGNAEFSPGQETVELHLRLAPLARGQHLIGFHALPSEKEEQVWDNTAHAQVEVMANTLGVLHLLGSPSWDGRFLRRYLKAEPKYDVISFFILRDPWDGQETDEREMSLIPFPVARLFTEELPRFKVLILQNFALLQFLQPAYQQNLVNFVKNGGGLLFLGGHRSLLSTDLADSPLKEILPFEQLENETFAPLGEDDLSRPKQQGPWYDAKLAYRVGLAKPSLDKRILASVYDDWEGLAEPLSRLQGLGLHHMEKVKWPATGYTPLLQANLADGSQIPLAVASYPGKGRALWVFSDSLWRLALTPRSDTPREVYDQFLQASMTWLLRQELKQPLLIQGFHLQQSATELTWQASLQGPASPYFKPGKEWQVELCGQKLGPSSVLIKPAGNQFVQLSGRLEKSVLDGGQCQLNLSGTHPAFGSVQARATSMLPQRFKDSAIISHTSKLKQLQSLTSAKTLAANEGSEDELHDWVESLVSGEGLSLPARFRSELDHYWFLESWWFWLCLLFLPLEILIRRWQHLRFI